MGVPAVSSDFLINVRVTRSLEAYEFHERNRLLEPQWAEIGGLYIVDRPKDLAPNQPHGPNPGMAAFGSAACLETLAECEPLRALALSRGGVWVLAHCCVEGKEAVVVSDFGGHVRIDCYQHLRAWHNAGVRRKIIGQAFGRLAYERQTRPVKEMYESWHVNAREDFAQLFEVILFREWDLTRITDHKISLGHRERCVRSAIDRILRGD